MRHVCDTLMPSKIAIFLLNFDLYIQLLTFEDDLDTKGNVLPQGIQMCNNKSLSLSIQKLWPMLKPRRKTDKQTDEQTDRTKKSMYPIY